ncbi:MAG: hypothetical protein JRE18_02610 [Deltaproteobacteria bacterium]|jgi:hypothetical protein|nr:hypothetical protein [Deltaproteobacteria bacterium]
MISAEDKPIRKNEGERYITIYIKDPQIKKRVSKAISEAQIAFKDLLLYIPKKKYDIWQNPLYVWEAITFCISNKKTFPAWLLNYLTEAGGNLLKATKTGTDKGNPETVSDAFGFNLGKGRSPFTNYLTTEKYIEVALAALKIIKNIKNGKIRK